MSLDVMNNDDLRRIIWSFLRKKAKLSCNVCEKVIIWDKKIRCAYYGREFIKKTENGEKEIIFDSDDDEDSKCGKCWRDQMKFLTWSGT